MSFEILNDVEETVAVNEAEPVEAKPVEVEQAPEYIVDPEDALTILEAEKLTGIDRATIVLATRCGDLKHMQRSRRADGRGTPEVVLDRAGLESWMHSTPLAGFRLDVPETQDLRTITVDECAAELGIAEINVNELLDAGVLTVYSIGDEPRVMLSEVQALVTESLIKSAANRSRK